MVVYSKAAVYTCKPLVYTYKPLLYKKNWKKGVTSTVSSKVMRRTVVNLGIKYFTSVNCGFTHVNRQITHRQKTCKSWWSLGLGPSKVFHTKDQQTIRVLAIIAICMMMIFSNFKNAIKNSMLVAMTMLLCVCVTSVYKILNGANIFCIVWNVHRWYQTDFSDTSHFIFLWMVQKKTMEYAPFVFHSWNYVKLRWYHWCRFYSVFHEKVQNIVFCH